MINEETPKPQTTPRSSSSSSNCTTNLAQSFSGKKDGSGFEGAFGRGRYKLWALVALVLLALWSLFTGTVTLKQSAVDLKHTSHDLESFIHGDLDVLDVEEREKMVRQMWNMYAHNSLFSLPSFWGDAFAAAYQDLTSEVASVRNAALLEIAKMSLRSGDIYDPPPFQSTASVSNEEARPRRFGETRKLK